MGKQSMVIDPNDAYGEKTCEKSKERWPLATQVTKEFIIGRRWDLIWSMNIQHEQCNRYSEHSIAEGLNTSGLFVLIRSSVLVSYLLLFIQMHLTPALY